MNSCDNINDNYFNKICKGPKMVSLDSTNHFAKNAISSDTFRSLRPLNILSDTFFLRIEHSVDTTEYIFEYSFYNMEQSFKVYRFQFRRHSREILFDKSKDNLKNFTTDYNSSKIGHSFISALEKNDILDLPDCNSIPGYYMDEIFGDYYDIQYSNKCMYHFLAYGDPYKNSKNIKIAKNLTNFLDYLKREFDFK